MTVRDRMLEGFHHEDNLMWHDRVIPTVLGDISKHLRIRKVRSFTEDELLSLAGDDIPWIKDMQKLIPELKDNSEYECEYDFSIHDNGYDISEYVDSVDKYIPNLFYLHWALNNDAPIYVNEYYQPTEEECKELDIRNNMVFTVDKYEFSIPKLLHPSYAENVDIPTLEYPVTFITINLPYAMYSVQRLPDNIYTYDPETETYQFGSKTKEQFFNLLDDIFKNGIKEPLFLRVHGQTLTSPDEDTLLKMLAASLLKLDTIPVHLYLSDEDSVKNELFETVYALSDVDDYYEAPMTLNHYLKKWIIMYPTHASQELLTKINDTYNPYYYFRDSYDDHITILRYDTRKHLEFKQFEPEQMEEFRKSIQETVHDNINLYIEKLKKRAEEIDLMAASNDPSINSITLTMLEEDSK